MGENEKNYLLCLNQFSKFGPKRLIKLKNYFPSWESAFLANHNELRQAKIEDKVIEEFIKERKNISLDEILTILKEEQINTISIEDDNYPQLLKEIFTPPVLLYYKGNIFFEETNQIKLAVVGSRKCTYYGKQVINSFIKELVLNNIIIVSGLALGIDSLAQEKTIQEGGKTIAVIGSGLDKASIYPKNNLFLSERIIEKGGGIISEFPPKTPPLKQNFPQRNRIISGLAQGTFVIEASLKSGSLITSRFALEQGREVFASPGNIYSAMSVGPNNLIKLGAKLVTNPSEILESFGINATEEKITKIKQTLSEKENYLLQYISRNQISINTLLQKTKLDIKTINSTLTLLEIKNIIKNIGNSEYVLN